MRFEYLVLADAANRADNGKLNVLGMGARILTVERLPAAVPLAILAAVAASTDEAGEYPIELALEEPDGSRAVLVEMTGSVPSVTEDARVPTGMGLTVALFRPFRIEGIYRITAKIGEETATYEFLVRSTPTA